MFYVLSDGSVSVCLCVKGGGGVNECNWFILSENIFIFHIHIFLQIDMQSDVHSFSAWFELLSIG